MFCYPHKHGCHYRCFRHPGTLIPLLTGLAILALAICVPHTALCDMPPEPPATNRPPKKKT
ncbi:MAG: hypothetical protein ACAI35_20235 [Candidatus Methylacidiphilales bacterium]|nr:hypothetical protein [Candidatus Methylacidiphilales bacterium]